MENKNCVDSNTVAYRKVALVTGISGQVNNPFSLAAFNTLIPNNTRFGITIMLKVNILIACKIIFFEKALLFTKLDCHTLHLQFVLTK